MPISNIDEYISSYIEKTPNHICKLRCFISCAAGELSLWLRPEIFQILWSQELGGNRFTIKLNSTKRSASRNAAMPSYQVSDAHFTACFLFLSVLLAGVPEIGARGGKGARGAGGGATRYGHRGLHNAAAYELTWEDMVLAMQLSAMCFGALIALCIVACCAYKICGPAEEEDWGRRYRSSFKVSRLPPELLREIYTVPTNTAISSVGGMNEKMHSEATPPTPPSGNTTFRKHNLSDGSIMGTAVSTSDHQRLIPNQHHNLPNGRAVMAESRQGCLSLGNVLEHRPRGITLSSLSTSRLLSEARRPGVAPRLAAHLNNSTLDLSHPHSIVMPSLNASSRSLSEPKTAIV